MKSKPFTGSATEKAGKPQSKGSIIFLGNNSTKEKPEAVKGNPAEKDVLRELYKMQRDINALRTDVAGLRKVLDVFHLPMPTVTWFMACVMIEDECIRAEKELLLSLRYFKKVERDFKDEDKYLLEKDFSNPIVPDLVPTKKYLPSEMLDIGLRVVRAIKQKYHGKTAHQ